MKNCNNCSHGSYGLDCNSGIETLYCRESDYEHEVQSTDVCNAHQFIEGYENEEVLGYDCDGNAISEFRVLRFPFSANVENWEQEPNIDPRFYCLVKSSTGEVFALSVYDDWNRDYIKKYEQLNDTVEIPMLIKSVSEMSYYEVAFSGMTGDEWYYDRDKAELRQRLDCILKEQKSFTKKLVKKLNK